MKIVYAITYMGMTGGVKVLTQHVKELRKLGHEVSFITRVIEEEWEFGVTPRVVPSFSEQHVPDAHAVVVTSPRDVLALWPIAEKRDIPLFHFLQGFEPDYALERINGDVIPERFRGGDLFTRFRYKNKIRGWKKKLKRLDDLYMLPTVKVAISPHLVRGVEERYNIPCHLLPNGIDRDIFHPKRSKLDYDGPIRLLSVGNSAIEYKAIYDIWEAVRILKREGIPVTLTRVSPADETDAERKSGVVDRLFVRISEAEIAVLYRESHILISASTEIEGFGLPPVEAMSSGTPTILTRVSPFLAFDDSHDYSYFVTVHEPEEIVKGVKELSESRAKRESIIERGYEVAEKYSLERMGKRLEEIIMEEISKRANIT